MNYLSSLQENASYLRDTAKNMMVVDNRSDSDENKDSGSEDSVERERNKYLEVKKKKKPQPIEKDDDIGFEEDSNNQTPPKRKVPNVEKNREDSPIQRNADTPTELKEGEEGEADQQSYVSSWLGGISQYAPQSERMESVKSMAASVMKNRY